MEEEPQELLLLVGLDVLKHIRELVQNEYHQFSIDRFLLYLCYHLFQTSNAALNLLSPLGQLIQLLSEEQTAFLARHGCPLVHHTIGRLPDLGEVTVEERFLIFELRELLLQPAVGDSDDIGQITSICSCKKGLK